MISNDILPGAIAVGSDPSRVVLFPGVRCNRRRRIAIACAAAIWGSTAVDSVRAKDIYWANPVSGTYSVGSNWGGGVAPGSGDVAHLNAYDAAGDPYTVTFNSNVTNAGLAVTAVNTNILANLAGHTWNIQPGSSTGDALTVGYAATNQNATLSLEGGTFNVTENTGYATSIATQANSVAYLLFYSGTFNNYGQLNVGESGSGEAQWIGGTSTVTGATEVGLNAGSLGRAAISNSGTVLNGGFVDVGANGVGDFYQLDGTFNVGSNLTLATANNSSGYYALSGGNLNVSGYAFINYDSTGSATFSQTGGNARVGVGLIVGTYSGQGIYSLGQAGANAATQLISSGEETIGAAPAIGGAPSGIFNQYNGSNNYVGYTAGGAVGATAPLYVGKTGSGVFNLYGGTVTVNGTLSIGSASGAVGVLNQTQGTITATNLVMGDSAGSLGTYNFPNGNLTVSSVLTVGNSGSGTLADTGGDAVIGAGGNAAALILGSASNSNGTYLLTGVYEQCAINGAVYVGSNGNGTMNQTSGTLTVGYGVPNTLYLGYGSGSGTYLLSANGILLVNGDEAVGWAGRGFVNQTGGANLLGSPQSPWHLYVGYQAGSYGTYNLSSTGVTTIDGDEIIGNYGSGVFNQSGGDQLINGNLILGANTQSSALFALSDPAMVQTLLTVTGNEIVGSSSGSSSSIAAIFQQSGGTNIVGTSTSPTTLTIGQNAGSTGAYQLSGGTLNASGYGLVVGGAGTGWLNQSGGILNTSSEVIGNGGTGTVVQTGGVAGSIHAIYDLRIGVGTGAVGSYVLSGGTLNGSDEEIGANGIGSFNQTGGTNNTNYLYVGEYSTGQYLLSGGAAYTDFLFVNAGLKGGNVSVGGSGVLNIYGSTPASSGTSAPLVVYTGGGLIISGKGAVNLLPHSGTSLADTVASLSISGQGTLDLTNNAIDLPGATLANVTGLVNLGYNKGTWTGTGITSSMAGNDTRHLTAVGVIQNNQSGIALYTYSHQFEGVTPGAGDILVKYTYFGDANLDGKVDGSDYSLIDSGFLTHSTGWFNGDFNYDGVVNGSDYTLIDNAFNLQGAAITGEMAHSTAEVGQNGTVPEPSAMFLSVLVAGVLGRRRRTLIAD